jgi:uncharacterized membrane protein (UPF0127 family)
MKSHKTYTCPIVEDSDGQLCIEFSDDILDSLDLKIGDVLQWEPTINNSWILKKVENNETE